MNAHAIVLLNEDDEDEGGTSFSNDSDEVVIVTSESAAGYSGPATKRQKLLPRQRLLFPFSAQPRNADVLGGWQPPQAAPPSSMATKRLQKELLALDKEPLPFIRARPQEGDSLRLHYVLEGLPGTPFAGGFYHGYFKFPSEVSMLANMEAVRNWADASSCARAL